MARLGGLVGGLVTGTLVAWGSGWYSEDEGDSTQEHTHVAFNIVLFGPIYVLIRFIFTYSVQKY